MSKLSGLLGNVDKALDATTPNPKRNSKHQEYKDGTDFKIFRTPTSKMSEVNSVTTFATARGLAKFAGYMANKGTMNGKQLLSEETWNEMHSDPQSEIMLPFASGTSFTKGGVNLFDLEKSQSIPFNKFYCSSPIWKHMDYQFHAKRKGFYGWMGLGGSVLQWNPDLQLGFGYVPGELLILDFCNYKAS